MGNGEALAHLARFGLRVSRGRLRTKTDPAFTPGIWHKNPEFRALQKDKGELSEQLWKALGSLNMPVHIVRGQASSILEPSLATKMLKVLGDRGTLSVVPRAGHAVMLDNPEKSIALIANFIANLLHGFDHGSDHGEDHSANMVEGPVRAEKELESRA